MSTTTAPQKKILTYSALSTYRKCPMRYNLRYEKKLIPVYTDEKLFFGTVIHKALEAWHGTEVESGLRLKLALEAIDTACKGWELDIDKRRMRILATEMIDAYAEQYRDDKFEVIALEKKFEGRIVNPTTNAESKTFQMEGWVDGIVNRDGQLYVLEHKTRSSLTENPLDDLWEDTQVGLYVAYLRDAGYDIVGVIYNELLKCGLKWNLKSETEEEFNIRYADACAKNKSGKSTAKRCIPETDEEFAFKVKNWYREKCRFQRTDLLMSQQQIDLVRSDVWGMTQQFLDARRRKDWFCNRESCHTFLGDCPYRRYCQSNYDETVRKEMFELDTAPIADFDDFSGTDFTDTTQYPF